MSGINNKVTGGLPNITTYTAEGVIIDITLPGNVTAEANVVGNNVLANAYFYANGAPLSLDSTTINNGTSNIVIPVANGAVNFNVNGSSAGSFATNAISLGATTGTDGFYVDPVRNDLSNVANVVFYNSTTKELTFAPATSATVYGDANVEALLSSGNITGNIITTANISGDYILGNGAFLTGLPEVYGNANVELLLETGIASNVVTTANVSGAYFLGNGSQLTGIVSSYGNSNVELLLETGIASNVITTGNISGGNIGTTGEISAIGEITSFSNIVAGPGAYFIGDGSLLTGLYGNANVSTYLASGTNTANIITTGNISGNYYIGNGSLLTGMNTYGNANVELLLETGIANNIITTGNVSANVFIGNGSQLTGMYGNSNVSTYLASGTNTANIITTGNVAAGNIATTGIASAVTLNVTGNTAIQSLAVGNADQSANTTSGAVVIAGGVGIVKDVNIGGNLNVATIATTDISATGNVVANGTGSFGTLVANGTSTLTGNVTSANIAVTGVISATSDITSGNSITATANVSGGNLTTAGTANIGTLEVTGTSSLVGNVTTANIAVSNIANIATLEVTGNATVVGNTASGNVLASTDVIAAGNVNGNNLNASANVYAGNIFATTNVTVGGTVITDEISGTIVTITAAANNNIVLATSGTGNIALSGTWINGVLIPVQPSDAASKSYVDATAQGLAVKAPVIVATTTVLPDYTYNQPNGAGNGVGATITAALAGNLVIDSILTALTNRVLVKDEVAANAPYNGIYSVTTAGSPANAFVLTRTADFDIASEIYGAVTFVTSGNINGGASYFDTNSNVAPVTFGTSDINWVQYSSPTLQPGNALSQLGAQFNVNVDNATISINGSNQLQLKPGANLVAPNIGNATFSSLSVNAGTNGNINSGNIVSTGNISGNNLFISGAANSATVNTSGTATIGGNATVTGNIAGGNLAVSGAVTAATVTTTGNAAIGDNLSVAGWANITGAIVGGSTIAVVGNISGGNSSVAGSANSATINTTGNASIGNNLSVAGWANITGAIVGASLAVTGNISANNISVANIATINTLNANTIVNNKTSVVGNPAAASGTGTVTVYTATADTVIGAKLVVRAQIGGTADTSTQLAEILMAKDATGNVSFTISNRISTDTAVADVDYDVNVVGNVLVASALTNGSSVIFTYDVQEYNVSV
jgi:hypothetical protein